MHTTTAPGVDQLALEQQVCFALAHRVLTHINSAAVAAGVQNV